VILIEIFDFQKANVLMISHCMMTLPAHINNRE